MGEGEGREEGGAIRSMSSHESERRRRKKGGRREEKGDIKEMAEEGFDHIWVRDWATGALAEGSHLANVGPSPAASLAHRSSSSSSFCRCLPSRTTTIGGKGE